MMPGETLAGPSDITLNEGRFVINKIDPAPLIGADLAIMGRMHGGCGQDVRSYSRI